MTKTKLSGVPVGLAIALALSGCGTEESSGPCGQDLDLDGTFAIEAEINAEVVIAVQSKQHFLMTFDQSSRHVKATTTICTIELPSMPDIAEITMPESVTALIASQAFQTEGEHLSTSKSCATFDPPASLTLLGADLSDGDPMVDALPTRDDLSHAIDQDGDGNPGVTMDIVTALCTEPQQLYMAVRTISDLEGIVEDGNTITGDPHPQIDASIVGHSDPCLERTSGIPIVMTTDNHFIAKRVDGKNGSPDLDTDGDHEISCAEFLPNIEALFGEGQE